MARIGYLSDIVLYGDLRHRLAQRADLVDLSTADRAEVLASVGDLDLLLHHPRLTVDEPLLRAGTRLRAVLAPGAGYDGIDLDGATGSGVLVTNLAGCNANAVAEHAIGLMLAVLKRIAEGDRLIRGDAAWTPGVMMNHELRGRTLGIVGLGAIGRQLATIAASGFAMPVVAHDPFVRSSPLPDASLVEFDDLLAIADVVSLHVPLTDDTAGLMSAEAFAQMRPGSILINTARGGIVHQPALVDAVRSGRLAGAGLDVVEGESLAPGAPLLDLPSVVLTPHSAGATHEAVATQADRQVDAVDDLLAGRVPSSANVLTPRAVDRFRERFGADAAS